MSDRESVLTPQHVHDVMTACLFQDNEPKDGALIGRGVVRDYGFHPSRLAAHQQEIRAMLAELPEQFHAKTGGGWSFLNACMTRSGEQWTGDHATMESLFALGMAAGLVECPIPRDKLCGVISWSWWWVLSPLWITAGLWVVIVAVGLVVAAVLRRKIGL